MTPTSRVLLFAAAIAWSPADAAPRRADLQAVRRALDSTRTEEAARGIDRLMESSPDDPEVLGLAAELRFQRADYREALDLVRRALARRRADEALKGLRDQIEAAERVSRDFVETEVAGGRFVVRHPRGHEAVLVPYVASALRAAADAIGEDLGERPPGPTPVEILPDGRSLAALSGLSFVDIERTGTIAVSKWGRLMVTSPRALVRGYPWLDTLTHEYVHLVLTRVTDDRAPIWLQEGIAKFEERRWREPPGGRLEPALAFLLDRAASTDRFLPFARMHPSIARLGSQEEAALAFGEVFTFVRFVHQRVGYEGIREILARVRAGDDAMDAVAGVLRAPWATLYRWWRGEIRSHRNAPPRAARVLETRFRVGGQVADETRDIAAERARRHVRIGDLLWERGRVRAAAVEFERASTSAPEDPIVANRFARALLDTAQAARVEAALASSLALYPDFPASHVHLGRARLELARRRAAAEAFEEALRLNPFDPEPHCALAGLLSDGARVRVEEDACSTLR